MVPPVPQLHTIARETKKNSDVFFSGSAPRRIPSRHSGIAALFFAFAFGSCSPSNIAPDQDDPISNFTGVVVEVLNELWADGKLTPLMDPSSLGNEPKQEESDKKSSSEEITVRLM